MHIASNGLRGYGGLQTTPEVLSDLEIQLIDLDYICFHVPLASKGLHEINDTYEEVYHQLTRVASPQVKRVGIDISKIFGISFKRA